MFHAGGQRFVFHRDAPLISRVRRDRETQLEGIPGLQYHRTVCEAAYPDFGTLEVGEDAYVAAVVPRLPANVPRDLRMICLIPMAEIETKNVDSRSEQATNHVLTLATGSYRRNDLGPA